VVVLAARSVGAPGRRALLRAQTRRVDERWAEERTDDVRSKSYDRAHIDEIQARYSRTDTE
jgi:hypothetical protein